MIDQPTLTGYGVAEPTASVHYCSPDSGHRLHHTIGMGRVPGWFVMTVRGCVGEAKGPFASESEAQAVADAWLATTQANRKARGL
jgi:hypothetical protein